MFVERLIILMRVIFFFTSIYQAAIGGLVSLCIGFSILSIAEAFYFLPVRYIVDALHNYKAKRGAQ